MSVEFEEYLGKEITLKGRISEIPWQHMIDTTHNFENLYYLDLEGGDQIVFYSKEPVICSSGIKSKVRL